jgi:hypothetical protein
MRRREFIGLLGGAAAWPLVACAQQPERMRHIGVLMAIRDNEEGRAHRSISRGIASVGASRRAQYSDRDSLGCRR